VRKESKIVSLKTDKKPRSRSPQNECLITNSRTSTIFELNKGFQNDSSLRKNYYLTSREKK